MSGVDYYQLFSLSPGATNEELKNSYRRLSLTHHPDRGGSTERMARLNEAYRTLSNPQLRKEYDQRLAGLELRSSSSARHADYHFTKSTRAARSDSYSPQQARQFWRRFIVFAIFGAAFLAYDIMSMIVLPSLVKEVPRDTGTTSPAVTSDLTDEVSAALAEMQQPGQ